MNDWTALAADSADQLVAAGKLRSPEWIAAMKAVPRHELVPSFYEQDPTTRQWRRVDVTAGGAGNDETVAGLDAIYANAGRYTKLGQDGCTPASSSSQPSLMARMLEALDVQDGHRVLEIGAGTGYNAALLSHRLGAERVFSVDLDAELVGLARQRLAALGYHPTLVAADGADGLPEHAPYDRIIATCSVPEVPWSWVDQLTEGGLLLVDVKRGVTAGNLVLLRRRGELAEGRFDAVWAGFMGIRREGDEPAVRPPDRDRGGVEPRLSTIGALRPWEQPIPWFLASVETAADIGYGHMFDANGEPGDLFLYTGDGSWAEITHRPEPGYGHLVWESGRRRLWELVEQAHGFWEAAGRPGWERFGLTVTRESQWIWLDDPSSVSVEPGTAIEPGMPVRAWRLWPLPALDEGVRG